jgi:two-component system phosphate regulon response regulator PhoB
VKSILIVDDDAASVALVEGTLAGLGYEIRSATGPAAALAVLRTWAPDVILLDMQLRGLDDGLEFTRRLKANVATRHTSVIAFTAYGDRWTETETRAAGCDGYLEKPITERMLADAIRQARRGGEGGSG